MNNPYLRKLQPQETPRKSSGLGAQAIPIALQLYKLKKDLGGDAMKLYKKAGDIVSRWQIGDTAPGDALKVTQPNVSVETPVPPGAEGGDALAIPGTVVEGGGSDLSAFHFGTEGATDAIYSGMGGVGEAGSAVSTEGLDAFNFDMSAPIDAVHAGMAGAGEVGLSAFEGLGMEAGMEAAGYGTQLGGLTAAQQAASAGGALTQAGGAGATLGSSLGTIGVAGGYAAPAIAAASYGMPVLGDLLGAQSAEDYARDPSSNLNTQLANLTAHDWMRPIESLSNMIGIKADPWVEKLFNPLGGILKHGCIIVSACTGRNSYEVNVTRKYRDRYMDEQTLTGYYALCIFIVPFIQKHPLFRRIVKRALVDRLVDYGEWKLDMKPGMKYATSGVVKRMFLGLCRHVGRGVDTVLMGQEA